MPPGYISVPKEGFILMVGIYETQNSISINTSYWSTASLLVQKTATATLSAMRAELEVGVLEQRPSGP